MFAVKPPYVLSQTLSRSLVWKIPVTDNTVFLSFDDGPNPEITPLVLSILDEWNAKATFFCVGDNVRKYPDLFSEITTKGHNVGNHTFNHLNGWKTSKKNYLENIQQCSQLINSKLFRPPYGKISPLQLLKVLPNYTIVMWSVLSRDFDTEISCQQCLNNVTENTFPGAIVVFHDSLKAKDKLLYTLPRYLQYLKEKDYICKAITTDIISS